MSTLSTPACRRSEVAPPSGLRVSFLPIPLHGFPHRRDCEHCHSVPEHPSPSVHPFSLHLHVSSSSSPVLRSLADFWSRASAAPLTPSKPSVQLRAPGRPIPRPLAALPRFSRCPVSSRRPPKIFPFSTDFSIFVFFYLFNLSYMSKVRPYPSFNYSSQSLPPQG